MDSDPLLNSTNIYDVILCKDEYSGVSETEKRHRSFMGRKKSTFGRLESSGQHSMSKGLATTSAGSKSLARRGTYNWTSGGGKSFNSSLGSKVRGCHLLSVETTYLRRRGRKQLKGEPMQRHFHSPLFSATVPSTSNLGSAVDLKISPVHLHLQRPPHRTTVVSP